MIAAATKVGRHGSHDATLILLAFRHGLRVGELVTLRWEQVDWRRGTLHVNRKKNGEAATHPLSGRELRTLHDPAADPLLQPAPAFEFDQRIAW